MGNKLKLSALSEEFLNLKTLKEHSLFTAPSNIPNSIYSEVYRHIEKLPLRDLPLYINHPSQIIRDIVKTRLEGRKVIRWQWNMKV